MENWKEDLEEYGELHSEFCDVNNEGGSDYGCDCDNMKQIKAFISSLLTSQKQHYKERVDEYIRERMKQIANSPFLERRNGFEELTKLNKDLALDIFGEGEGL